MAIMPATFITPPTECCGCAELRERVEELEKLTAHLRPRLKNDRDMREEERQRAADGLYSGKARE